MANYLLYPCKVMNITQTHDGATSHSKHKLDRPWDESCEDSGRSWCYCPCNEMVVKRVYGIGNGGANSVFLESTSKVKFADGSEDFFCWQITHSEDEDLRNITENQHFYRGDKICREGGDGGNTRYKNHFHFSGRKGKFLTSKCWDGSTGAWCITSTNDKIPIASDLFYVDTKFTTIKTSKGYDFVKLPADAVVDTTDKISSVTGEIKELLERKYESTARPEMIWKLLIINFKTPEIVAGIMGNLYAESALIPINVENSKQSKTITDLSYTNKIDNKSYSKEKFIKDSIGYGLAQWTHSDWKKPFYEYWETVGGSIGSLLTQIEFLYIGLKNRSDIFTALKNSKTVKEASNVMLLKYEIPADRGTKVQNERVKKSEEYYKKFKDITEEIAKSDLYGSEEEQETEEIEIEDNMGIYLDYIIFYLPNEEEDKN